MDAVGAAVVSEISVTDANASDWTAAKTVARTARPTPVSAARAIDPASLRWHEGVVCLRALVEVFGWVAAGTIDGREGHPWIINGPAFAARLSALTGTAVTPR